MPKGAAAEMTANTAAAIHKGAADTQQGVLTKSDQQFVGGISPEVCLHAVPISLMVLYS